MYIAGHKYGICQIHKSDRAAHSFIIDKLVLSIVKYSLQTVNYTSSIVTVFMHCKHFFFRLHTISARENETSKSKLKVLVIMLSTLLKILLS